MDIVKTKSRAVIPRAAKQYDIISKLHLLGLKTYFLANFLQKLLIIPSNVNAFEN